MLADTAAVDLASHGQRVSGRQGFHKRIKYFGRRRGVLADMAAAGVEAVDCVSVDNALARVADPLFAGFCWERSAQCGAPLAHSHKHTPPCESERSHRRTSIACPRCVGFWERSGVLRCALWAPTLSTCTPKAFQGRAHERILLCTSSQSPLLA